MCVLCILCTVCCLRCACAVWGELCASLCMLIDVLLHPLLSQDSTLRAEAEEGALDSELLGYWKARLAATGMPITEPDPPDPSDPSDPPSSPVWTRTSITCVLQTEGLWQTMWATTPTLTDMGVTDMGVTDMVRPPALIDLSRWGAQTIDGVLLREFGVTFNDGGELDDPGGCHAPRLREYVEIRRGEKDLPLPCSCVLCGASCALLYSLLKICVRCGMRCGIMRCACVLCARRCLIHMCCVLSFFPSFLLPQIPGHHRLSILP